MRQDRPATNVQEISSKPDDASSAPIAFLGQAAEIERLEARLAGAEARYRQLVESSPEAVAVVTRDGFIREANARWQEVLGYPPEAMVGRSLREFAPPGRDREHLRSFTEAVAQGKTLLPEVEFAKAGGGSAWFEISLAAFADGDEPRVLARARDISARRQLEAQLRRKQKLEALGRLAGGVAHDFNNILTAILGYTDLLLERAGVERRNQAHLLEIKKAGERAAALTHQLLAFGRKQMLRPMVFDVGAMVENLQPMLLRLMRENVRLAVQHAPVAVPVKMDPSQMEQVLVNLVINAADAMPSGGVITLTTTLTDADDDETLRRQDLAAGIFVRLSVADEGMGMDVETRSHIFEPFFTTKKAGTGMGLATVYGIVTQSGGHIAVETAPERGSCFHVYLPRGAGAPAEASAKATADSPARIGGNETILLVEDEEAVRALAYECLEGEGYHVLEAANPRQAWQVASDFHDAIHLVVSDVIMPDSEGAPLCERLQAVHPETRWLYMSGYSGETLTRQCTLAEGAQLLPKPFTLPALKQMVREALGS